MLKQSLIEKRQKIEETIKNIAQYAPQNLSGQPVVRLLAVSKMQTADSIRALYQVGQKCFGENYLQEALEKQQQLTDCAIEWHFIGHLQSRKAALVAKHFDWVHSVDRIELVSKLNQAMILSKSVLEGALEPTTSSYKKLNICIQVLLSHEHTKSGIVPEALNSLVTAALTAGHLRLRGLMTLPEPLICAEHESADDFLARQRLPFRQLAFLFQEMKKNIKAQVERGTLTQDKYDDFDTLSMGMSDSYQAAILEGANFIRLGTALFGERPTRA